jgi:glycine/D-amino acid oxidase-like deaminating enzyme
MRIAILGAGFSGLAVTWYLLHYTQGSITVDLFDPTPIGGGASGISSGLLYPYAGKHAKRAWEAHRCLKETHRLITEASRAISQPIILSKGIVRPALTEQQIADFQACAKNYSDTNWWSAEKCTTSVEGIKIPPEGGALFIPEGLTLDAGRYLQGLWQACALLGTQFYQQSMISQEDLEPYDRVLMAMGPLVKNFLPLKDLPITAVKGQILEMQWPSHLKPPPYSLISQKYLTMSGDQRRCFIGSTYERQFDSAKKDPQKAFQEIMPDIISFFPALKDAKILDCRAAFRASSHNHLPMVGKVSDKFYFFTGLGSKGLLYHAWVGKRVARTLITTDIKHLPPELYYSLQK